jgi:L-2-hydroxyglutarate oxidase LhgO
MLGLLADVEANGGVLACAAPVRGGAIDGRSIVLTVGGPDTADVRVRTVVNCAGLEAPRVAASLVGFPAACVPAQHLCKGNYYTAGRPAFSRLVYPVPESAGAGLGVHVTLDLAGQMRFGPDVQWIDAVDYSVDPRRADAFYAAIRTYWPALRDGSLTPAYAGIRPKLHPPGGPAQDFRIDGPARHGVPGLVHLFGIESPGLTACLAIAEYVVAQLG